MFGNQNSLNSTNSKITPVLTERLRKTALAERISIINMAEATGTSRQTMSRRLENHSLTLDDFLTISELIGINPNQLLAETQEEITQKTQ